MTEKRICELRQVWGQPGHFTVTYAPPNAKSEDIEKSSFTGPDALDRAIAFAAAYPDGYYDGWRDPEDWGSKAQSVDFV